MSEVGRGGSHKCHKEQPLKIYTAQNEDMKESEALRRPKNRRDVSIMKHLADAEETHTAESAMMGGCR